MHLCTHSTHFVYTRLLSYNTVLIQNTHKYMDSYTCMHPYNYVRRSTHIISFYTVVYVLVYPVIPTYLYNIRIVSYTHMHPYVYGHMKSSFPKRDKRHSKKWVYIANANFVDCILEKSSSYIYTHTQMCIPLYEELFSKTR